MKERKRTTDKERIFSFGGRSKLKSKDFTKKKKKNIAKRREFLSRFLFKLLHPLSITMTKNYSTSYDVF